MNCPKCGHSNPDENKYCGNCGTALSGKGVITLKDLVDAGLIRGGDKLTIKVKGKDVTATVSADGKLEYQNRVYDGPLACATAIRGSTCDSWFCWKAVDHATGDSHGLGHYRSALLKQRG